MRVLFHIYLSYFYDAFIYWCCNLRHRVHPTCFVWSTSLCGTEKHGYICMYVCMYGQRTILTISGAMAFVLAIALAITYCVCVKGCPCLNMNGSRTCYFYSIVLLNHTIRFICRLFEQGRICAVFAILCVHGHVYWLLSFGFKLPKTNV